MAKQIIYGSESIVKGLDLKDIGGIIGFTDRNVGLAMRNNIPFQYSYNSVESFDERMVEELRNHIEFVNSTDKIVVIHCLYGKQRSRILATALSVAMGIPLATAIYRELGGKSTIYEIPSPETYGVNSYVLKNIQSILNELNQGTREYAISAKEH